MARYRVLILVLSGMVEVFPIEYYVDPSFIRRVEGIFQILCSKTELWEGYVKSRSP
jgi:hypothetical protein